MTRRLGFLMPNGSSQSVATSKVTFVGELTDYPEDLRWYLADVVEPMGNGAVELDGITLADVHHILSDFQPHHSLEHEPAFLPERGEWLIAGTAAGRNGQDHELEIARRARGQELLHQIAR